MTEPRGRRRLLGGVGFRVGLLAGLATPIIIIAASYLVGGGPRDGAPDRPRFTAMVRTRGESLSALGGTMLILKDGYDAITQTCRGQCDDLSVDSDDSLYGGYGARVLNAQGVCVACAWAPPQKRQGMIITSLANGGVVKSVPELKDY